MENNYYYYNQQNFINLLIKVSRRFKNPYWLEKDISEEIESKYETNLDRFIDEVIWPYGIFISKLNSIPIPSDRSKLNKQLKFSDNCKKLIEVFKNKGFDKVFEEQKSYDKFVIILQDHLTDYIDDNLESEVKRLEANYYKEMAFSNRNLTPSSLKSDSIERKKQEMMENLIGKRNYSELG